MIIARFGDDYNTAYSFAQFGAVDDWSYSRPAVYARVGGLPGAFDFYGDANFPLEPFTLKKTFIISGSSAGYAGVETAISALQAATISASETRLWGLRRDGGHRWMWAKCTRLNVSNKSGDHHSLSVTLEFLAREGMVWYAS